jgi:hypothetical protein
MDVWSRDQTLTREEKKKIELRQIAVKSRRESVNLEG